MSVTPPSSAVPRRSGGSGRGTGRPRRILAWAAAVVVLAAAALVAAALIPGSHATGGNDAAVRRVATGQSGANTLHRQHAVFGSKIAASRYGTKIAALENGVNADGQPISDLTPLPARRFDRPIADYRAYAQRWAGRLGRDATALTTTLRSGDRGRARGAWSEAFSAYLHLGAVYGLLPGRLENRLAEVPASPSARRFPGLHRIEKGLWTGASPRSLVGVSTALQRAVATLRGTLGHVAITPLDYATRAHEILEDAQRDLMSGAEVPWSGEGVLGTAAGLVATRRVIATLVPLLDGRENTLGVSRYWLGRLGAALHAVRRSDGSYPTLRQLSDTQRLRIDGALAGTLNALSEVPGTLETKVPARIPAIPDGGAR